METLSAKITYRLYEEKDIPAIIKLWEQESGWGSITTEQFNKWFVNTPYGKAVIVVAENSEAEVIGQIVMSPSRMIVDGREIKSLRGAAPIVSKEMRGGNIKDFDHPVATMFRKGFEMAFAAGYQYFYSFPAYGWLGLLRLIPRMMPNPSDTASFDCFSVSLSENQVSVEKDDLLKVVLQTKITDEYDNLWNEAVEQMPIHCSIVRKASWLQWVIGGMYVLEVRNVLDDKLVGYAAIKKESGLVVDVFARTGSDLAKVYQQCVYALHQDNSQRLVLPFNAIKGMITPLNEPILNRIGYTKDDFRFAFGSYLLDKTIDFEKVKAANWYMTSLG
jgi:hypothetical protein